MSLRVKEVYGSRLPRDLMRLRPREVGTVRPHVALPGLLALEEVQLLPGWHIDLWMEAQALGERRGPCARGADDQEVREPPRGRGIRDFVQGRKSGSAVAGGPKPLDLSSTLFLLGFFVGRPDLLASLRLLQRDGVGGVDDDVDGLAPSFSTSSRIRVPRPRQTERSRRALGRVCCRRPGRWRRSARRRWRFSVHAFGDLAAQVASRQRLVAFRSSRILAGVP